MTPQTTRMDVLVGTVLEGAYRITRLIGEGGMGAVYEAVQLRLNKRVAVKVMARDLSANREAIARFRREAEITSHLGHPHLVNVVDFGQAASGEPYLVMEFLEGEDLEHRLRRVGRMPIEAVVHVVKQAASALNAAHDQGIVHRDMKPGNVFLMQVPGEPDFVKVLDFGISKMKAARTHLTSASAVMGTPNYMSPEQATGMVEDIDQRADQWALACIAWEMLLGRGPFVADDVSAILYQIINLEPHPLTPRVPGLPLAVEPVLRRALSKRLEGRFPSMREFSRELEAATSGRLADATPAPVPVPAAPGAGGTVLYGATPVTPAPVRPPAGGVLRAARKPDADVSQAEDNSIHVPLRNRIKPIYAIIVGAGLALLLGVSLLISARRADVRPSSAPATAPKPMPPPATIAKPALGPTVTPLLAPEPPPPTVAAPQPAPLPPTRGEDAKAPVARRPQPALAPVVTPVSAAKSPAAESFDVDKFLREHDQRKTESIDSKRRQDPWADDSDVSTGTKQNKKPVAPSAAKPPATRKPPHANPPLFEEL